MDGKEYGTSEINYFLSDTLGTLIRYIFTSWLSFIYMNFTFHHVNSTFHHIFIYNYGFYGIFKQGKVMSYRIINMCRVVIFNTTDF